MEFLQDSKSFPQNVENRVMSDLGSRVLVTGKDYFLAPEPLRVYNLSSCQKIAQLLNW
jgi:hypothetical protein